MRLKIGMRKELKWGMREELKSRTEKKNELKNGIYIRGIGEVHKRRIKKKNDKEGLKRNKKGYI